MQMEVCLTGANEFGREMKHGRRPREQFITQQHDLAMRRVSASYETSQCDDNAMASISVP